MTMIIPEQTYQVESMLPSSSRLLLSGQAGLPSDVQWWLQTLSTRLDARRFGMSRFQDYYDGAHPVPFVTPRYRTEFADLLKRMRVNFCRVSVEFLVERLTVQGFRMGADQGADSEAWRIWQANHLDAVMARGLRTALTKGEAAAIVWRNPADERTPVIELHDPNEVIVGYDRRVRAAALQRWYDQESQRVFATLYLPDRLYRFQSAQRQSDFSAGWWAWASKVKWERRTVPGEAWPQANPWNVVPVIPIVNQPNLSGVGVSELADVTPLQDAINKETWDGLVASEFGAFRQRWIAGIDVPVNAQTGQPEAPFETGADNIWTVPPAKTGEEPTRFGEFGESNITAFREMVKGYIQQWATIKRLPPHYLLGEPGQAPSGESLRAAEAGLVSSARGHQRDFSEPLEEIMRLAFLVAGDKERAGISDSQVIWADPETHSESERIDALVKQKSLGVPDEILWEKAGYSPQEIARIRAAKLTQDLLVNTEQAEIFKALVQAGVTPESAERAAGVPELEHTGHLPVTVQP